jgi:CBS domain-containing protein
MTKPISLLMNADITVIDFNDTIDKVEDVMTSHSFSCLPVMDSNQGCFGVICYPDIVRFHRTGKNPKVERVWELCTHNVLKVSPDTSIRETAILMLKNHFHHIIVAEHGIIKGIVSSMDFVADYVKQSA